MSIFDAKMGPKMEEMRRRRLPAAGRCENGVFRRLEDAKTASPVEEKYLGVPNID